MSKTINPLHFVIGTLIMVAVLTAGTIYKNRPVSEAHIHSAQAIPETKAVSIIIDTKKLTFVPSVIRVKHGVPVDLTLHNHGIHDLQIQGLGVGTHTISDQQEATVHFIPEKVGQYTFYCSVPGHRDAGMKGTMIVE